MATRDKQILSFGIPSLDELLGHPNEEFYDPHEFGISLEKKEESTSLCLIGPDGTGKSVLALHLASHYASQATDLLPEDESETRVLYVSTDLSFARAKATWENFALDQPGERIETLERLLHMGRARAPMPRMANLRVDLEAYHPLILEGEGGPDPLTDYMMRPPRDPGDKPRHRVAFIDLEANTAGDDWGLINRLLAALDKPGRSKDRHLLIIDAVEGLETLGGDRDAFGHQRNRRSRVAQILRAAQGKCHVVFIVEEPKENERLPEAFVSDAVIRLRVVHERDYDRRTVEIEKLRGQAYVRGQHDCMIRRGAGSLTGSQPNSDHPDFKIAGQYKAYFLAMPSLQYLSREIMEKRPPGSTASTVSDHRTFILGKQPPGVCGFGIRYLDEMIGYEADDKAPGLGAYNDWSGLPWGAITALIGDEGTHKGRLGRAFLAQAFRSTDGGIDVNKGVALLLTTRYIDHGELAHKFLSHDGEAEPGRSPVVIEALKARTFCRRLEIHHMSSAVLFSIIHALVQEGLKALLGRDGYESIVDGGDLSRCPERSHGRVRLVIDDWSGLQDAYPEIKADPLFLPFLVFYLQRQGITTLIIDTQPGRLGHILAHESDRELRALVPYHIYTWHVTFIGEKRVAIASLPPIDDKKPFVIRELKPYEGRDEQLMVDPHFEYYAGFEEDKPPRAVPLRAHLYQGEETSAYLDEVNDLLNRLYGTGEPDGVVRPVRTTDYNLYRDFVYLQGSSALEHSLVLQVDEFWSPDEGQVLSDLWAYLDVTTADGEGTPDLVEDPFRLFQPTVEVHEITPGLASKGRKVIGDLEETFPPDPTPEGAGRAESTDRGTSGDTPRDSSSTETGRGGRAPGGGLGGAADPGGGETSQKSELDRLRRRRHFEVVGYDLEATGPKIRDRVPYTVDFGILLADQRIWSNYFGVKIGPGKKRPLGDVWRALTKPESGDPGTVTWREVFEACLLIAARETTGTRSLRPFDVDRSTVETFSCLVFEVWASEAFDSDPRLFPRGREPERGLVELISPRGGRARRALFRAWLLLNSVLDPYSFEYDGFQIRPGSRPVDSTACRHWYSTASAVVAGAGRLPLQEQPPRWTPLRLPGHYTTRGDWFLGVAKGSRSQRLAERAIDLLSSRRANIMRLQTGVGLPVRGFPITPAPGGTWVDDEFRSLHLRRYDEGGGPSDHGRPMRLHEIWELGGTPSLPVFNFKNKKDPYDYYWLWRSGLRHYDRHSRIWSKWLVYALHEMRGRGEDRIDPSAALDDYERFPIHPGGAPSAAFERFDRLCDVLVQALNRSTIAPAKHQGD